MSGIIAITNSSVFLSSPIFRQPIASTSFSEPYNCDSSSSQSMLLKRKRPAMIQIPSAPLNFIDNVAKPEDDHMMEINEEGEGYSVYCKRGKRGALEDRYSTVVNRDSKQALFGVFDGHGGAKAAEFSAKNLNRNIMLKIANRSCQDEVVEGVREGYCDTDLDFLKEDVNGGACCVTALIHKGKVIVSNAGDCRAVMSRGGVAEALTVDHRPSRRDEKDRIESMGGYVDCRNGVWRIQGSLAVSRGIGDKHLKKWVIAEPETRIIDVRPECEFLILASDGIWDTVNNQEAIDIVRPFCVGGTKKPDLSSACRKLVGLSVTRGSYDDMSVMIILLPHFIL
ncbi:hypothetical protein QVD17_23600 [Tagetes erecta]|uniref:protein-serine/threonine phosphatase n=1 Tax=Tagetes erecta TaxID=13708 RepID=A0AAD8KKN6_TARER|nr:hypothetical protein QVD17_23600 [Tagetes erecta]